MKCVGVHVGMVGIAVFVMHINLNLIRNCKKPLMKEMPASVERILGNGFIARILFLPAKLTQPSGGNLINEDDDDDHIPTRNVQELIVGDVTNQVIVAELIDRVMLLSYILFLVFFHS